MIKYKEDNRPQCGWWAPGKYLCKCHQCGDQFIGDKRAGLCADCAYAIPINPTGTESEVCRDIAERQALGIAKYGTTVQNNPLPLPDWLDHAYEEALDLSVYLKRSINESRQLIERIKSLEAICAQQSQDIQQLRDKYESQ